VIDCVERATNFFRMKKDKHTFTQLTSLYTMVWSKCAAPASTKDEADDDEDAATNAPASKKPRATEVREERGFFCGLRCSHFFLLQSLVSSQSSASAPTTASLWPLPPTFATECYHMAMRGGKCYLCVICVFEAYVLFNSALLHHAIVATTSHVHRSLTSSRRRAASGSLSFRQLAQSTVRFTSSPLLSGKQRHART
jgi:hypothetical protein